MKIKFGSEVVDGRGKIGGHVYSRNRGGAYKRTKVTPVNPRTDSQFSVRARFASLSAGWRSLTSVQRTAWIAATPFWVKTNIFGDQETPSGIALYQKVNNHLLSSGGSSISTPAMPLGVLSSTISSITYASGTPALTLVMAAAVPAGTRMRVWATPAVSPSVAYVKNKYRLITTVAAAGAASQNILSAYTAVFGAVGAVGTRIYIKVDYVDQTSGLASAQQSSYKTCSA